MNRRCQLSLAALASLLFGLLSQIEADDPSQVHCQPECAANPPYCATVPHASSTECPLTSNSVSSCEYQHCHLDFISCLDWWTMLDLNCLCDSLSSSTCTADCRANVGYALYLNWLCSTCGPVFSNCEQSYQFQQSADLKPLGSTITTPTCFSGQDQQDLSLCLFDTSDVASVAPSGYNVDASCPMYLDRDCYCSGFSFQETMDRSSCQGIQLTQSLVWLDNYCGDYHGFQSYGMPNDWQNLLLLANASFPGQEDTLTSWQGSQTTSSPCADIFHDLVQGCDGGLRCGGGATIDGCNSPIDTLSLSCFSDNFVFPDTMQNASCYEEDIGYSEALIWLENTCQSSSSFQSQLPHDWHNLILQVNTTFVLSADQNDLWPQCLDLKECASQALTQCGSGLRCGGDVFSNNCSDVVHTTNLSCLCDSLRYFGPCGQQCTTPWWDRGRYLDYLYDTCAQAPVFKDKSPGYTGLPSGYEVLCDLQGSELLPWTWQILPDNFTLNATSNNVIDSDTEHCPSEAGKLASFAIVNLVVAIVIPILGRRTLINRLTGGLLGKSNSRTWIVTGLLGVGLHLGSNAINAKIIKDTPGYSHINITHLTFLWCTRPRLGWLAVALVDFQASKAMYFSVTASTLIVEFVLQILGAVYMGIATNYGRTHRFYNLTSLRRYGGMHGHYAQIMYAGCLLWCCVFPFALLACAWSILDIYDHLSSLSTYLSAMTKTARRQRDVADDHVKRLHNIIALRAGDGNTPGEFADQYRRLSAHRQRLLQEWDGLQLDCQRVPTEMHAERRQRDAAVRRRKEAGTLKQDDYNTSWFSDPARFCTTARNEANAATARAESLKTDRGVLETQLKACERRIEQLKAQQRSLKEQSSSIFSTARAAAAEENEARRSTLLKRVVNAVFSSSADNASAQLLSDDDQDRLDALEREQLHVKEQISGDTHRRNILCTIDYAYQPLIVAQQQLAKSKHEVAKQWEIVANDRRKEAEALTKRTHFRKIPTVVFSGMLLTWIAQWLWWAGYVRVAADT